MYRRNVCAVIFNEEMQFLGCQRIREELFQFVQGGVERSDTDIVAAALREVEEEVGLLPTHLQYVGEIAPPHGNPKAFRYALKPTANLRRFGYIGQEQRLLVFYSASENIEHVRLVPPKESGAKQEFSHVAWMPIADIVAKCPEEKHHIFAAIAQLAVPMAKAFLQNQSSL